MASPCGLGFLTTWQLQGKLTFYMTAWNSKRLSSSEQKLNGLLWSSLESHIVSLLSNSIVQSSLESPQLQEEGIALDEKHVRGFAAVFENQWRSQSILVTFILN